MDVTIYHNPACSTSRTVLGLIRDAGIEPEVVEYLKTPPSRTTLAALAAGVPIAFRPQFVDGPANAQRVADLGAGIVATDLATAVEELLGDRAYRDAAERIAGEMRALPPVDDAVELFARSR